jgi:hypothetical protein
MSTPRRLSYYGYVDRPYEAVRRLVLSRADELFQRATTTASESARDLVAELHAQAAGLEVGVDIRIDVAKEPDDPGAGGLPPVTQVALSWKAAERAAIFPSMSARLSVSPMTFAETRVEFEGIYQPPLGAVGRVLDSAIGHRFAEASVHRFVNDVIEQIRRETAEPA